MNFVDCNTDSELYQKGAPTQTDRETEVSEEPQVAQNVKLITTAALSSNGGGGGETLC